ncbi:MAG: methyltransferase domain-containing protein [Halieaceae bacterium]|jgi:predicted nicotinamide N-methyase|nr:methyltransferase domain-containing protein [Halieaceae bacterium]
MAQRRTEYRFHGVKMLTSSHPEIRRIKRSDAQPSIHGNKLWRSSFLLIDYLKKHPPQRARRVMDAGCGWGMGGVYCARALSADVTSVDADRDVFPYLLANAAANGVDVTPLQSRFEKITTRQLEDIDLLIAADICFWDELVNPVFNLVKRAVNAGVGKIVIADPERPTFFEMAQRCQDKYCADIISWRTRKPLLASGSLMVLENA